MIDLGRVSVETKGFVSALPNEQEIAPLRKPGT